LVIVNALLHLIVPNFLLMAGVSPDKTSIAPWLSITNSKKALAFYQAAFGAVEMYRMDVPDGIISRLSVEGAEFWVAEESAGSGALGGGSIRMILTVKDPDALYQQAIRAGATSVYPVSENHGWRIGRIHDPYGLHWEIGKPVNH
jgi:PhnB protein